MMETACARDGLFQQLLEKVDTAVRRSGGPHAGPGWATCKAQGRINVQKGFSWKRLMKPWNSKSVF